MKKFFYVLFGIFILIQFFQIDKTNPAVNKGMDFLTIKKTPEKLATQIRNSCYDCHSNETKYPWYSTIQPFGWFLKNHIDDGRKHLNFSQFSIYEPKRQAHKLDEAAEEVEKSEMPMESYLLIHDEARYSAQETSDLVAYFRKLKEDTMVQYGLSEADLHSRKK